MPSESYQRHRNRPGWTAGADDWCRETAARMHAEGYAAGPIIDKLEAYGCGLYAAQEVVRQLQETAHA